MTRTKFPLPTVINPPDRLCVRVNVPDDPAHIQAFTGALLNLTEWYGWERDSLKRGREVASVWWQVYLEMLEHLYDGCEGGDCPADCIDFPNSASFIEYAPQNPFTQPDYVPPGYSDVPFYIAQTTIPGTDLRPGDVLTDITRIPLYASLPDILAQGFPRFRIPVTVGASGQSEIEIHLLRIPQGGLALINQDDDPLTSDFIDLTSASILDLADLNALLGTALDGRLIHEYVYEKTITGTGDHFIDVTFLPKVTTDVLVGFGGGFRKLTICGDAAQEVDVFDIRLLDGCILQKTNDGGTTWEDVLNICYGANGGGGDDDMMLRQNPDNPCLLEWSRDCSTWTVFADLSLCPGTPPNETGIPDPGFPNTATVPGNCELAARAVQIMTAEFHAVMVDLAAGQGVPDVIYNYVLDAVNWWINILSLNTVVAAVGESLDLTSATYPTAIDLIDHYIVRSVSTPDDMGVVAALWCSMSADGVLTDQNFGSFIDILLNNVDPDTDPFYRALGLFIQGQGVKFARAAIMKASSEDLSARADCDCEDIPGTPVIETSFNFLGVDGKRDLSFIHYRADVTAPYVYHPETGYLDCPKSNIANSGVFGMVYFQRSESFIVQSITITFRCKRTRGGSCYFKLYDENRNQLQWWNLVSLPPGIPTGVEYTGTRTLNVASPLWTPRNAVYAELVIATGAVDDDGFLEWQKLDFVVSPA